MNQLVTHDRYTKYINCIKHQLFNQSIAMYNLPLSLFLVILYLREIY